MTGLRLRQLVIAARSVDTIDRLQDALQLDTAFIDPGVAEFGLTNAVFAIGDQFLEVVVPVNASAPAQRFLDRCGEGGYMAIFQVPDLEIARQCADRLGVRRVWNIDLEDIAASHLHPGDIGGAIVSLDTPKPPGAWRWGGPDWTERSVPGQIIGATLQSPHPNRLAQKWADVLGTTVEPNGNSLKTDDGYVRFEAGDRDALTRFHLALSHLHDQHSGGMQMTIGSLDLSW
ncbi:MAG: hypothetical protein AAFY34_07210 [Pseudomonadota bacterium]